MKKISKLTEIKDELTQKHIFSWRLLRLVAVQCPIPRVSSLTVTLIGRGSVDAGGEGVTVVETQPAFLYIRTGGVGPDRILLFIIQVLQLHLHFQGSRWGRGLRLRAGRAGRVDVKLDRYSHLYVHLYVNPLCYGSMFKFCFVWNIVLADILRHMRVLIRQKSAIIKVETDNFSTFPLVFPSGFYCWKQVPQLPQLLWLFYCVRCFH